MTANKNSILIDFENQLKELLNRKDLLGIQQLCQEMLFCINRYEKLLSQANQAIVLFNIETLEIVDVNQHTTELVGYTKHELLSTTICSLHPEKEREFIKPHYLKAAELGFNKIPLLPMIRKDHQRIFVDVSAAKVEENHQVFIQSIYHDITEQTQQHSPQLTQALSSPSENQINNGHDLLAEISNQLHAPLNRIIGYNSLMREGLYGELNVKQQDCIHQIDQNATHMLSSILQRQSQIKDIQTPQSMLNTLTCKQLENRKIMIVSEPSETITYLCEFLEAQRGYQVKLAISGMHAMMALSNSKPNFLVINLIKPEFNGARILKTCRELWGDQVCIIILVDHNQPSDQQSKIRQLADQVIQSDLSIKSELVQAVDQIIPK